MGYVETLFGHQAPVLALDALRGETAVSAGGREAMERDVEAMHGYGLWATLQKDE